MRTPEQIIGQDALTQLIFEGYKVERDLDAISIGDHVAENQDGRWQGVVIGIRRISGGVAYPGIAVCDTGRGSPREWNLTRLIRSVKPDFVDWPMPLREPEA
jgi:hypothetical protein